uniref:CmtI n=1 Tax=Pseudomonas putida TaxID=303 RepID=Q59077_PSEPU|nr:cmtI [Pseudomonas putida]ADI95389.1 CmtI [Pseudomonas putida DOT-T1E]BAB17777.1 cmtI [Pseudomonas putida]prf//2209341H cmtI gene [Pseudomonas putida]
MTFGMRCYAIMARTGAETRACRAIKGERIVTPSISLDISSFDGKISRATQNPGRETRRNTLPDNRSRHQRAVAQRLRRNPCRQGGDCRQGVARGSIASFSDQGKPRPCGTGDAVPGLDGGQHEGHRQPGFGGCAGCADAGVGQVLSGAELYYCHVTLELGRQQSRAAEEGAHHGPQVPPAHREGMAGCVDSLRSGRRACTHSVEHHSECLSRHDHPALLAQRSGIRELYIRAVVEDSACVHEPALPQTLTATPSFRLRRHSISTAIHTAAAPSAVAVSSCV